MSSHDPCTREHQLQTQNTNELLWYDSSRLQLEENALINKWPRQACTIYACTPKLRCCRSTGAGVAEGLTACQRPHCSTCSEILAQQAQGRSSHPTKQQKERIQRMPSSYLYIHTRLACKGKVPRYHDVPKFVAVK